MARLPPPSGKITLAVTSERRRRALFRR